GQLPTHDVVGLPAAAGPAAAVEVHQPAQGRLTALGSVDAYCDRPSRARHQAWNNLVDGLGCSAGQPYALLERIAHLLRRHLLDRLAAGNTRDQCLRLRIQRHAIPSSLAADYWRRTRGGA